MLAAHPGIPLEPVELVVEGVFDPPDQVDGLDGSTAPVEAATASRALNRTAAALAQQQPLGMGMTADSWVPNNEFTDTSPVVPMAGSPQAAPRSSSLSTPRLRAIGRSVK
jgi:hypothetical protein